MRHRQGSVLCMNVFLYDDIYFKIVELFQQSELFFSYFDTHSNILFLYIKTIMKKKNMFIGSL